MDEMPIQKIKSLADLLTLEEKVQLLTGRDFWSTWPSEKIGLRSIVVSDGPSGVRGPVWDERSPSVNLPSATTLGSSWDPEIAYRYGSVAAIEARRKQVDVVLGPTINLHRSPLNGRHFEAFSEDPLLTADLAAAYVRGIQDLGIGATPKHYVANDSETDRFNVDVQVDEQTLHEVYLRPFEETVASANAWLVMSSYNSVNGQTVTENDLLDEPLCGAWGFDGVVISDWTAVRSLASAKHNQHLVMPGPKGPWGDALVEAVREGEISEQLINEKVVRLIRLASRVGALESNVDECPISARSITVDPIAFSREAASEGTVLLRNKDVLPISTETTHIAVIGQNARLARTQGGGSATVIPEYTVSPLEGIVKQFPNTRVDYCLGAVTENKIVPLAKQLMRNPLNGKPGALVSFWDDNDQEIFSEDREASTFTYFGGDAPVGDMKTFIFTTDFTPAETADLLIGVAGAGNSRIYIDDQLIMDSVQNVEGMDLGAALLAPPESTVPFSTEAGKTYRLKVELERINREPEWQETFGITIGTRFPDAAPVELIAEAVELAAHADVAIVVVGTTSAVESEGYDRQSLALPGNQDDLVTAVAAANPNTVVVVNAGAPVEMPWKEEVAAILVTYFGGQEAGNALADVLSGAREPGGRLPTTWPHQLADSPTYDTTPKDGVLTYNEGLNIGYRGWLNADRDCAYPFGFGLGYTSWSLCNASSSGSLAEDNLLLHVRIANTGNRAGKQVIQVYAERSDSTVNRPPRWLIGHAVVRSEAGQDTEITIPISKHSVEHWDTQRSEWDFEPGTYTLKVGTDVLSLPFEIETY